jgi:hypothetical protein
MRAGNAGFDPNSLLLPGPGNVPWGHFTVQNVWQEGDQTVATVLDEDWKPAPGTDRAIRTSLATRAGAAATSAFGAGDEAQEE